MLETCSVFFNKQVGKKLALVFLSQYIEKKMKKNQSVELV